VEERGTRTEWIVGALLLAGIVVAVWAAFSFGGGGPKDAQRFVLLFDSALGLSEDNTVAIAGVKVGVVEGIHVEGGLAKVDVAIDKDVAVNIDASAAVRQKTLLGERYVDVNPGTSSQRAASGTVFRDNDKTTQIDEVIRQVAVLVERLNRITPPLESALARIDESLRGEDGAALFAEALATVRDARVLFKDAHAFVEKSGNDFAAVAALAREKGPLLVDRLDRASARVDALLESANPKAIEEAMARIGPAAENVERITEDMKVAMLDARKAAQRLDGVLARLDGTLRRLDSLNEGAIREFLQIEGVRVNLIPDASVTTRVKKLREESVPLPKQ
jgi:phospholipid/cholesterol/gamma-HCH transport system substrate-binding protein